LQILLLYIGFKKIILGFPQVGMRNEPQQFQNVGVHCVHPSLLPNNYLKSCIISRTGTFRISAEIVFCIPKLNSTDLQNAVSALRELRCGKPFDLLKIPEFCIQNRNFFFFNPKSGQNSTENFHPPFLLLRFFCNFMLGIQIIDSIHHAREFPLGNAGGKFSIC